MKRVGATGQIVRYGPGEVGLPAAISQVVGMEMNRGVFRRSMSPAMFRAYPGCSHHGPRREIDQTAMATVRPGVGDILGLDAAGEVPRGEHLRTLCRPAFD